MDIKQYATIHKQHGEGFEEKDLKQLSEWVSSFVDGRLLIEQEITADGFSLIVRAEVE